MKEASLFPNAGDSEGRCLKWLQLFFPVLPQCCEHATEALIAHQLPTILLHEGLQQHLSPERARLHGLSAPSCRVFPKNLKAYEAFTPPSGPGRGVAYDFRLVRVVAKIARGVKEHDLKEASLFSNTGEGRCLRWLHDFPFSRLESATGATMAHHQ